MKAIVLSLAAAALSTGLAWGAPVTAERIAREAPAEEQAAWSAYLERSQQARAREVALLNAEVAAAKLPRPLRAADSRDFRFNSRRPAAWYGTDEARNIAGTIISFQTPTGGWSKAIDMTGPPRARGMAWTSQGSPWHYAGTLDNDATTAQIRFLATLFTHAGGSEARAAALRGIDYLLAAQMPNGGWPQGYPLQGGYHDNITFNDDAMIQAMRVLDEVAAGREPFGFVDADRRAKARQAVDQGIRCLLAAQYVQNGQLTVWCAQHDALTLAPVAARRMEPASLSGHESVGVVRFLLDYTAASRRVSEAVEAALSWFERTRLLDERGEPRWARFADLETNRPLFYGGQDGIAYETFEEMAKHNGTDYAYYVTSPAGLLAEAAKRRK
jgi:PelA/Pel-15E family pectate lyase